MITTFVSNISHAIQHFYNHSSPIRRVTRYSDTDDKRGVRGTLNNYTIAFANYGHLDYTMMTTFVSNISHAIQHFYNHSSPIRRVTRYSDTDDKRGVRGTLNNYTIAFAN